MIVIDSADTTHNIYIIPRYYNIDNTHTLSIKDDDTNITTTPTVDNRTLGSGYIIYQFDLVTSNNKGYDITITDNTTSNIVWRGKMFATDQVTQDYKIHG